MRKSTFGIGLVFLGGASVAAYAQALDPAVLVRTQEILLSPFPVTNVTYTDSTTGTEVTRAWSSLTAAQQREQLPNEQLFVEIAKVNANGSISILPAKVTAEKGSYQFNYRWMKFRTQYCNPANPSAGHLRVGIGLEITASATTKKSGLNVAGLGPLQLVAGKERVAGSLSVSTIGLGTNSAALGGFLGNAALSESAATEADKAISVVKAVIENNDTKLTPHTLAVLERTPGACTGILPEQLPTSTNKVREPTLQRMQNR